MCSWTSEGPLGGAGWRSRPLEDRTHAAIARGARPKMPRQERNPCSGCGRRSGSGARRRPWRKTSTTVAVARTSARFAHELVGDAVIIVVVELEWYSVLTPT